MYLNHHSSHIQNILPASSVCSSSVHRGQADCLGKKNFSSAVSCQHSQGGSGALCRNLRHRFVCLQLPQSKQALSPENGEGTGNSCRSQHSRVFGQLQMIYVDLSEMQTVKSKPAFGKASKNNDSYISSPAEAGIHWDR